MAGGNFIEFGKIIAINLNELGTERNLTLGQLPKISGISKAILSNIGRGNNNPTINILWKITNGLSVPYTRLMEGIEKEATVIREFEPTIQIGETGHYHIYYYFTNTPIRSSKLFYVELDAHSSNVTIGHLEKTQEYIYTIQGALVLQTSVGNRLLNASDALVFDSSIGHTYINDQDTLPTFIAMDYYPNQSTLETMLV